VADIAGVDVILVGESPGMAAMGLDTAMGVKMDEMLINCRRYTPRNQDGFFVTFQIPFVAIEMLTAYRLGSVYLWCQ
jgi:3-methyl-2-oxobutanoate hydroxymethyltransferase